MKKLLIFLIISLSIVSSLFTDHKITRGPDIGELYFIGPTATGEGIYHSTDFGETASCMDSTLFFQNITADLTPGVLYGTDSQNNTYISYSYGQVGSWTSLNANILIMQSGRVEGHVYDGISRHSDNYGVSFINHTNNGFFGSLISSEIDIENNVGYALINEYGIYDSLWLLISYDDFENLEIQHIFNDFIGYNPLTRGFDSGDLYMLKLTTTGNGFSSSEIWHSNNYGSSWEFKNYILCSSIVGGNQLGELYLLVRFTQHMGEIRHTYIYHSLDYGETFTVHHTFAYGPEPYYANFEANPTSGSVPLTVQFTDLSSGENIYAWEWDFDSDGVIDSYEQNPEYTYQDSGCYSVNLKIFGPVIIHSYIKRNYIHVSDGNNVNNSEIEIVNYELDNFPNPFNPTTIISYSLPLESNIEISIYNIKHQKVKTLVKDEFELGKHSVIWYGKDDNNKNCCSGVYFYQLKVNGKTEAVRKCLLLK